MALYAMGIPLTATGRLDEAQTCLTEALQIFQDARQQFWEGMTLYRLAEVHLAARRWRQSAAHVEQSLIILREVGGEWRTANALTVLGRALGGMDQPVRAHACWQDALSVYTSLGSPEGGGRTPAAGRRIVLIRRGIAPVARLDNLRVLCAEGTVYRLIIVTCHDSITAMSCPPGGIRGLSPGGLGTSTSPQAQGALMSARTRRPSTTEPVVAAPKDGPVKPDNQYNDILPEAPAAGTAARRRRPDRVRPSRTTSTTTRRPRADRTDRSAPGRGKPGGHHGGWGPPSRGARGYGGHGGNRGERGTRGTRGKEGEPKGAALGDGSARGICAPGGPKDWPRRGGGAAASPLPCVLPSAPPLTAVRRPPAASSGRATRLAGVRGPA